MSLGGSSSSNRSSSQSSGFGYGIDASQSNAFLDAQQQANQQGLVDRFNRGGEFANLRATPGLDYNRRSVLGDLRHTGNQLSNMTNNIRGAAGNVPGYGNARGDGRQFCQPC